MLKKGKDIANELQELAPGANWPENAPFRAPEGYFDALPEQILQKVRQQEENPVNEELSSLSPLLAGLSRQQPLSVPDGNYFHELPERIMSSIHNAPATGKVVPLRSRRPYWKWAVAAGVAALIGASTLLFFQNNRSTSSGNNVESLLASVSDQEIVEYLQSHSDAFDSETIFSTVANGEGTAELTSRISAALNDVPAEAIESYIENTGLSGEVPTN